MIVRACLGLLTLTLLVSLARAEPTIADRARSHWAYRPVVRLSAPTLRDRAWPSNPLDSFILARLEKANLKPAPQAERRVLFRRAFLDLIGLPPSPDEQTAFLDDESPDAWSRLVERLLADPRYGERWGRHWLDVARYADTNGYERDGDKPFAWRYRDYVVDAFNADLGYDQFVREQIAGDELPNSDARMQIATTFLRLGTWDDEPANDAVDRYDQLDDVLGVTTAAFLAQTVRCARCHDHKFEPFAQKEYYGLLAVFDPLKRPQQGRTDLTRHVGTRAELTAYQQARSELTTVVAENEALLARLMTRAFADSTRWPKEVREAFTTPASKRTGLQNLVVNRHKKQFDAAIHAAASDRERAKLDGLAQHRKRLEGVRRQEPPSAYIWYEEGPKSPVTRILHRGNPATPRDAVEVGIPTILTAKKPAPPTTLERSTGRRLWLANWIASVDNPLTARVIVNRLWQWHFGTGLVRTASDFGLAGDAPSHPELLDWLASELMQSGWSLKHLHRLILQSSTYRTSSANDTDGVRKLALFGRWKQRRVEAEVVRDAMLAVSGQLTQQQHGPGVYPELPKAVLATQSRPGLGWGKSTPAEAARRSIYVFSKRSLAPPELELLDVPDSTSSCECRPVSTTAPQALTFLNGAFANEQATLFADRLIREAGDDRVEQVRLAYRLALSRAPTSEEEKRVLTFLEKQTRQVENDAASSRRSPLAVSRLLSQREDAKPQAVNDAKPQAVNDARRRALASFCLVLFNTAEFSYPG